MTRQRTNEQPLRVVASRWTAAGVLWARLACGHERPCTDRPIAVELRCLDCNPVRTRPAGVAP